LNGECNAFLIDAAVNVVLLLGVDGALVPRTSGGELAGARQAEADLMQACAEVFVVDASAISNRRCARTTDQLGEGEI
jgi:hypothetical protein